VTRYEVATWLSVPVRDRRYPSLLRKLTEMADYGEVAC